MNESIESGGCILYPARRITVAIGAGPNLWLFFGKSPWKFDKIYIYQHFFLSLNAYPIVLIIWKTFHKLYGEHLIIWDVFE